MKKITEKQHRAELAEKGYAPEDIDVIAKAKCADGAYAEEGDEDEGDEEMEKALRAYETDLRKAEDLKKLAAFPETVDPNWTATNPETRPPFERTEIPEDIDGPFTGQELLQDIIKALTGAVNDAVAEQTSDMKKALAPLAKAVSEQTAIMKAQGALIKAQAETIGKIAKAARRADEKAQRALGSQPAAEQPKAPQGYRAAPEPGQRLAPTSVAGPSPALVQHLDAEAVQGFISKALNEMDGKPAAQLSGEEKTRYGLLHNALLDTFSPGADLAEIAKAIGYHPQA